MQQAIDFIPLLNFQDYEILNQYPYSIRRKQDHYLLKETLGSDGYYVITLNGKQYKKHQIIAKQFIPNPNNLPRVDHLNHIRTDNYLSNLCWASDSQNSFNISFRGSVQYQYVDDIPDDAIKVLYYDTRTERREFDDEKYYYYHDDNTDEDIFYAKIYDNLYKILHINIQKSGKKFVSSKILIIKLSGFQ